MSELYKELITIACQLDQYANKAESSNVKETINNLENAAKTIGKAWSGSWLGYHATVYYENFQPPPPSCKFSPEWGIKNHWPIEDTTGKWREFSHDGVIRAIYDLAGNPCLDVAQRLADEAKNAFEKYKTEVLSILMINESEHKDSFISQLIKEIEKIEILTQSDIVYALRPKRPIMSRDSLAVSQGILVPPHLSVLSTLKALQNQYEVCSNLARISRNAASHLSRKQIKEKGTQMIGTKIFIGHGQSTMWKELKDFIQDRLKLPWDEFNRVPVAGVANIIRLSEMLDLATFAFLILTGEDEQVDGDLHARLNVVHEAGLFQGRLGFNRAIILLEEGCEEFSNIHGLGQIHFPKGNLKNVFEDIRRVLEREGLL